MNARRALAATWAATTPAERRAGREWYALAEREARELAAIAPPGIGPVRAAAIIAALSPRAQWSVNVRWARAIVRAAKRGEPCPAVGLPDGRAKAWRIVNGESPGRVLRGAKVRAFWRAIAGDLDHVVLDIWMMRAANRAEQAPRSPREYHELSDALRAITPARANVRDVQAAIWLHVRGDKPTDGNYAVRRER